MLDTASFLIAHCRRERRRGNGGGGGGKGREEREGSGGAAGRGGATAETINNYYDSAFRCLRVYLYVI